MFTEEEKSIRDTVRSYCQENLMPRIVEANRNEGTYVESFFCVWLFLVIFNRISSLIRIKCLIER